MKTMLKVAVAAIALVAGTQQAQAGFFTAAGSVQGQPIVTNNGSTGTITFNEAAFSGGIHFIPGFYTPYPFFGRLNFSVDYDLNAPTLVSENQSNVLTSTNYGLVFNSTSHQVSVTFADGIYDGTIKFSGAVPTEGAGGLNIAFRGNSASGFNSTFFLQVPEPATWGMMLVGFGIVGASLRQRARKPVAA